MYYNNDIPFGENHNVAIDAAHSELLTGLVKSNKPESILEIGIGNGAATDAILLGADYNKLKFSYDIVDCWWDWGGVMPPAVTEKYGKRCDIITSFEQEFVFSTEKTYDFIMCDGDHFNTDKWFEHVYANLLNSGGILVYHDVTMEDRPDIFVNLRDIYHKCKEYGINHKLFDRNSLSDERCWRGLLVIFKD